MLPNINALRFIVGTQDTMEQMCVQCALPVFSAEVIEFLDTVSRRLLKNTKAKRYPDVITFAFWCRKANVLRMRKAYESDAFRLGRGVVFHIAPSNVAVNFAYSLVSALLGGNASIVRLPSKQFKQVELICETLSDVLGSECTALRPYICLVHYEHNHEINVMLSAICDVRVIWGGDNTIAELRKAPLKPRANEITFADRYSITVIDSDFYINDDHKELIANDFYNDTYLTDQNACTSPKLVVWLGNQIKTAQECFWSNLHTLVAPKYTLQPKQAINKLSALYLLANAEKTAKFVQSQDNLITRVQLTVLNAHTMDFCENSGFFMEYAAKSIDELLPVCSAKCQTLSYYGVDTSAIKEYLIKHCPAGIDRVVPIGKTLDFSLIWDGYDLIESMSRIVNIIS